MKLDRQHKLMLLFLSEANPLWKKLYGEKYKKTTFYEEIANQATFGKWKRGLPMETAPEAIFAKTLKKISARFPNPALRAPYEETVTAFQRGFENPKTFNVYAAAERLGITLDVAQKAIDSIIYAQLPLFPRLLDAEAAQNAFDNYYGAYEVWVRRIDSRQRLIYLRAALRVRSPIDICAGQALRCKLNFPIIGHPKFRDKLAPKERDHWFEYDGFCAKRDDHINFLFEKRLDPTLKDPREDYFNFITSVGEPESDGILTLAGRYLTLGQGYPREIVSDELVMRRVATDDRDEIMRCMRSAKVITAEDEIAYAESLFNRQQAS